MYNDGQLTVAEPLDNLVFLQIDLEEGQQKGSSDNAAGPEGINRFPMLCNDSPVTQGC